MRAGGEQPLHVRQAARAIHRVQRFQVVLGDGERDVHVREGAEHAADRVARGRDEVGGHGEDRLVEAGEHRRQAGEWGAGRHVGDHDDVVRQVRGRLIGAADREADDGEDALQKGDVALQQRGPAEAQPPLVAAHAPRLSSGEDDADAHTA